MILPMKYVVNFHEKSKLHISASIYEKPSSWIFYAGSFPCMLDEICMKKVQHMDLHTSTLMNNL